jgi:peptidyl-prolyl cis-trans isomerase C
VHTSVTLGVIAVVGLAGCSKKEASQPAGGKGAPLPVGVLARVNDAQLTEADLQRMIPAEFRDGITGAEIRDILDRWVRAELLYQKARSAGVENDPQVAARLHELEREMLADEMLQRELANRVTVGTDDLQAYYRAHQSEYTQEVWLKQVLVDSREEAEEILQQLRNGASFEELARQRSIDPSSTRGGDLGYLGKGAMNPAFEPFVFGLQTGEYTTPIATTYGFHVLKVAGRRPSPDPISFEAARDEIFHNLLLQKQQAAQGTLLDELRSGASVDIASSYAGMALVPDAPGHAGAGYGTTLRPGGHAGSDSLESGRD